MNLRTKNHHNCPYSANPEHSSSLTGSDYYCASAHWIYTLVLQVCITLMIHCGIELIVQEVLCSCKGTTPPWFHRQLNQIMQHDVEARICTHGPFSHRSTLIDQL